MSKIAVVTTFPNQAWNLYAKDMLESFVKYWPKDIGLFVCLDDAQGGQVIQAMDPERPHFFMGIEPYEPLVVFKERNKGRDNPQDYRLQASRFAHKVAALKDVSEAIQSGLEFQPDYVIWLDADVITKKQVTHEWIESLLPASPALCSYLGRKDWPHSECGFIAWEVNAFHKFMEKWWLFYQTDTVFDQQQWDDSWLFDIVRRSYEPWAFRNLSEDAPGNHVWPHTALAERLTHYKGPEAKQKRIGMQKFTDEQRQIAQQSGIMVNGRPLVVQSVNSIDKEFIKGHVDENLKLIDRWVEQCNDHDEPVIMCSGGPSLDVEKVKLETGRIVAVKHAVKRLVAANVMPWAVILLDPREHVKDFIDDIPVGTIVFVASQCNPEVTKELLDSGHKIIGYHAPVGVDYEWPDGSLHILGGSATSTRGMALMSAMGFRNFKLYGYDLCFTERPDMSVINEHGSPRHLEIEIKSGFQHCDETRKWWTEGQFAAQIQEIQYFLRNTGWNIDAYGPGIVPWLVDCKKRSDLKQKSLTATIKMHNFNDYVDTL